jgi:hypothetical protein
VPADDGLFPGSLQSNVSSSIRSCSAGLFMQGFTKTGAAPVEEELLVAMI